MRPIHCGKRSSARALGPLRQPIADAAVETFLTEDLSDEDSITQELRHAEPPAVAEPPGGEICSFAAVMAEKLLIAWCDLPRNS